MRSPSITIVYSHLRQEGGGYNPVPLRLLSTNPESRIKDIYFSSISSIIRDPENNLFSEESLFVVKLSYSGAEKKFN